MYAIRAGSMMVLAIVFPLLIQLWDRRRLRARQQPVPWNFATWGAALYGLSFLSLLGWFWVTRTGWRKALGLPWAAAAWLLLAGAYLLLTHLLGLPE